MKVLMVCTEYPPMPGGVGRYTANLVHNLRKLGIEVHVACNEKGEGQFSGLSPENSNNATTLLRIVSQLKPDLVHIQFEPGLYGLVLDPINPRKSGTFIDSFFDECEIPIVTTFHTGYDLRQWISCSSLIKRTGRIGILGIPLRASLRLWKYFLNYKAFCDINRHKLAKSKAGVTFSKYMAKKVGGGMNCHVIYHGAEKYTDCFCDKRESRQYFGLPRDKRIALVFGFETITKGWDILPRLELPPGWIIVCNSSKGHFNRETIEFQWKRRKGAQSERDTFHNPAEQKNIGPEIIDLDRGFLDEKELSMLFQASDAVLLPYKVTAGSGVMFDCLANGIPFVASDLGFFNEYAALGLGLTSKRNSKQFSKALKSLDSKYELYSSTVRDFAPKLRWQYIAKQHADLYQSIVSDHAKSVPLLQRTLSSEVTME